VTPVEILGLALLLAHAAAFAALLWQLVSASAAFLLLLAGRNSVEWNARASRAARLAFRLFAAAGAAALLTLPASLAAGWGRLAPAVFCLLLVDAAAVALLPEPAREGRRLRGRQPPSALSPPLHVDRPRLRSTLRRPPSLAKTGSSSASDASPLRSASPSRSERRFRKWRRHSRSLAPPASASSSAGSPQPL
jgi:hypothetical protein